MRVALYARVSSEQQAERGTIASQVRALREYAERQGWQVVGEYLDDGKSASAGKLALRGAFARVLADAQRGAFDALVINELSRLTRTNDWTERGQIIGSIQRAGVRLVEAASGQVYDLSTGIGDLLVGLRAWVAADDNQRRMEAAQRGWGEAALRGRKPAGQTPYGYDWDIRALDGSGWSEHPERAAIVREIFARVSSGETGRAIARDLERRGVEPPRKGRAAWSGSVLRIIHAPVYRGQWQRLGVAIPVPRLVDDATWYAAQAALSSSQFVGLARARRVYLLEGLVRCARCGGKVYVHAEAEAAGGERRYHCRQRQRPLGGQARCDLPMLRVELVEQEVWRHVVAFLSLPRERILKRLRLRLAEDAADAAAWAADLAGYRQRLAQADEAEAGILDRYARGLVEGGQLDRVLRDLRARRVALRAQISAAETGAEGERRSRAAQALATLDDLRARLGEADPAQRREVVRALVSAVELDDGAIVVRLSLGQSAADEGNDEAEIAPCDRAASFPRHRARSQGQTTLRISRPSRPR